MGTVLNAPAAMYTNKRLYCGIKIDGIDRTRLRTLTAADAKLLSHNDASSLSLRIGTGRAGLNTRGRVACKTGLCFKTC